VLLLAGCGWGGPAYWQRQYDREIEVSTRAIATAHDDAARAQGHSARGRGYSEKARYSRSFKLISHCQRGTAFQRAGNYDPAIADYEEAMALGASDPCECQPESPLAWIYMETRQYDKSWEVVHKAQGAGRWIQPELLEELKKASGRDR